jgi:hypothetical protein
MGRMVPWHTPMTTAPMHSSALYTLPSSDCAAYTCAGPGWPLGPVPHAESSSGGGDGEDEAG